MYLWKSIAESLIRLEQNGQASSEQSSLDSEIWMLTKNPKVTSGLGPIYNIYGLKAQYMVMSWVNVGSLDICLLILRKMNSMNRRLWPTRQGKSLKHGEISGLFLIGLDATAQLWAGRRLQYMGSFFVLSKTTKARRPMDALKGSWRRSPLRIFQVVFHSRHACIRYAYKV